MSVKVRGIVVGYDAMIGVILLRHKAWPSLEHLAAAYEVSDEDKGFWFAKFRWSALLEADRARISHERSRPPTKRTMRRAGRPPLIRDIILGRPATCLLLKNPKWEATAVALDLEGVPFRLPERCYSTPRRPRKRAANHGMTARRIERLSQSRPSNLLHPWGAFVGSPSRRLRRPAQRRGRPESSPQLLLARGVCSVGRSAVLPR